MRYRYLLALRAVAGLGLCLGCSVPVTATSVGSSRADAIITMAYEYGPFENPQVNRAQMYEDARVRCQSWGYTEAQAFAGQTRECIWPDGSACWL